ncbi:MAG: hypothetical protein GY765_17890, partial [bacterium]|nr:hypothetical protein [bacterium]
MQQEALRIQAVELEKENKQRADEAKARKRRRKWAAVIVQGYAKTFLARKILRHAAYKRFMKYFDVASHNYYYEDIRTHAMSWEKPKSLGSYDITMVDYWIIMYAKTAAGEQINITVEALTDPENEESEKYLVSVPLVYYYNPCTWKQTWDRPEGTVLCQVCNLDFVMRKLNVDECVYCEACFAPAAQAQVDAGVHPKYVTFKPFQGGSQNAYRTDFYNIKDDS